MTTTYDRCKRTTCRSCGAGPLEHVIDMGPQAPSNALLTSQDQPSRIHPLLLVKCTSCSLVQLGYDVPPEEIFHNTYPYFSSKGSQQWLDHSERLCLDIWDRCKLRHDSLVMEIGSNDGYLLKHLRAACQIIGVEPSAAQAVEANRAGVPTICQPFGAYPLPQADVIIALNTVAQIPDLKQFAERLSLTLKPGGTAILEFPPITNLVWGLQFDTIYHEHYSYLGVVPLDALLRRHGMCIYDVEKVPVHGGSLRVFVKHGALVGSAALDKARQDERAMDYRSFLDRVIDCAWEATKFLYDNSAYGYGAAAKGNTFLNYCGLGSSVIPAVADVSPAKVGKFLPGSRIPIISEADLIAAKPEHILLLAWNWRDESVKRLRAMGYTGKFVVAVPKLEVFE